MTIPREKYLEQLIAVKTMERITTKEALRRFEERYKEQILNNERKNLIGLDLNDYASVFLRGSEVTILEYYQDEDTLTGTLMSHKQEILEQVKGATDIILQVIAANSHELMMKDMDELADFVDLLGKNVNIYWDLEYEETSEFKVKIEVYIVK